MRLSLCFFILVLAFAACKQEGPTRWDTEVLVPIATASLRPLEAVDEEDLAIDEEGVAHIVFDQTVSLNDLAGLNEIPDTTIAKSYTAGLGGLTLELPAGIALVTDDEGFDFSFNQAQMRELRIKSGTLFMEVRNYVEGDLTARVDLPTITNFSGEPFFFQSLVPAKEGDPGMVVEERDLAGFVFNLTGPDGSDFNLLTGGISVETAEAAMVSGTDSLVVGFRFEDVIIDYALGFFGQYNEEFDEQIDLDLPFTNGSIEPEKLDIQMVVRNSMGVDLVLALDELASIPLELTADEVPLDHSLVDGNLQLARAFDDNGIPTSNEGIYNINEGNSNITQLIASMPSAIQLKGNLQINPLGNISANNDFFYSDFPLEADLRLDLPLCVKLEDVVFKDTIAIDPIDWDAIQSGILFVEIAHDLPLEIVASLMALEEESDGLLLLENAVLASASANSQKQVWEIALEPKDIERLSEAFELELSVGINSEDDTFAKFDLENEISLKVTAKFVYEASY